MAVSVRAAAAETEIDDLIRGYFDQDYKYREICAFLKLLHGCELSPDRLKRRTKEDRVE